MPARVATLLVAVVLAGCFGADRIWPDESDQVVRLHVNAYEKPGEDAVAEVTGRSADNGPHAFRGHLRVVLERQGYAEPQPTYAPVTSWERDVEPGDFSNPGEFPLYKLVIPRATFPGNSTYRVAVRGEVGGRALEAEALFYAEP